MRYKNFNEELEFEQDITWEPGSGKTWVQPLKELNDTIAERIFEEMGISDFFVKLVNEQSDERYDGIASDWGLAKEPDIRFRMPFAWGYAHPGTEIKEKVFPDTNTEWITPSDNNYTIDPNRFFRTFDVVYMNTGALFNGEQIPYDTVRAKVDYDNMKIYYKVKPNIYVATNDEVVVMAHNRERTGAKVFGYDNRGRGIVLSKCIDPSVFDVDIFISKSWPWDSSTVSRSYGMLTFPCILDNKHLEVSSVGDSEFNTFNLDLLVGWNDNRKRYTGIRIDTKDVILIPSSSRLGTLSINSHNIVTIGNSDWYQVFGDIFIKLDKEESEV